MCPFKSLLIVTLIVCANVVGFPTPLKCQSTDDSKTRDIVQVGTCPDGRMWFWRIEMSEDGEPQTITTHSCDSSKVIVPVRLNRNAPLENDAIGISVAARTIEISSLHEQPVLVQLFTPVMGQQTGSDWLIQPKARASRTLDLGQYIVVVREAHSKIVLKTLLLLVD